MSDPPHKVLKTYIPKRWRAWRIGQHLTDFTNQLGLIPLVDPSHGPIEGASWVSEELHAEVRRFTAYGKGAEAWHQDGDLAPGSKMDHALVLWTNRTPTLFRKGEVVFQPKPFEVVIVRNLEVYHRRPDDAPLKRWLFRQRVEVPPWLKEV